MNCDLLLKKIKMGVSDKLFEMKNQKAEANLKAGEKFLEENGKRPGVVVLASGLQYEIMTEGTGAKPSAKNKVTCHYHGTLIDGTVFDSSVQRGQPATFPLNMVIKGWTEGLQLMAQGSKWRFFIPPHLGYGDRQVSPQIGPNSTLIFEVELLGIS
jgi:FKBP-type peptidyl-prolyl cis-trans isomerase FklB